MLAFKHILVATDLTEVSRGAIDVARDLARETGAALTVVHTCEVPTFGDMGVPPDLLTPMVESARTKMEDEVRAIRGECPCARTVVRVGAPSEQILALAEEVHADLLVVGTHGRRGLAHALIGSVAERLVRTAPVPVLTVGSHAAPAAAPR